MESETEVIHEVKWPLRVSRPLYANRNDQRVLVPSTFPGLARAPNFGRPITWALVILAALIFLAVRRR